jgi:hypothetical protein
MYDPAESRQKRHQHGRHGERSRSFDACKFNRVSAYDVLGRHSVLREQLGARRLRFNRRSAPSARRKSPDAWTTAMQAITTIVTPDPLLTSTNRRP